MQDLSLSAFLSPHVPDHEPKWDKALTTVIDAYDRSMAELQYRLIANQGRCVMELKAKHDMIVTSLRMDITELHAKVNSLWDSLVFTQEEIEEIKREKTEKSAATDSETSARSSRLGEANWMSKLTTWTVNYTGIILG